MSSFCKKYQSVEHVTGLLTYYAYFAVNYISRPVGELNVILRTMRLLELGAYDHDASDRADDEHDIDPLYVREIRAVANAAQ